LPQRFQPIICGTYEICRRVPRQVANALKLFIYGDKINFKEYLKMAETYLQKAIAAKN
jgi:hypothetical protein